jgi:uncharacterized repeat protein (TIGR03803 family)
MNSRQAKVVPSKSCGALLLVLIAMMVSAVQLAYPQTKTTLHSFSAPDGAFPNNPLLLDAQGNLYGTAFQGGAHNRGTVFSMTPDGTETVLYSFKTSPDATTPGAGLIRDDLGNLYGTTVSNGGHLSGAVFQVSPDGKEKVLWGFKNHPDGKEPRAGLVRDAEGNLYGTTFYGGDHPNALGHGIVFQITPDGTEKVLYRFTGDDGSNPNSTLLRDAHGNLYGTTLRGGAFGFGTVFVVASDGTERVLYSFAGGTDGTFPAGGLVRDGNGNFYATTGGGGDPSCSNGDGCGTVFKLTRSGTETILYHFAGGDDGQAPYGLSRDGKGNFYGTTAGGAFNSGTVFRLAPDGTKTLLYAFTGGVDGAGPSGVIRGKKGALYGVTLTGGTFGVGTVFKVIP